MNSGMMTVNTSSLTQTFVTIEKSLLKKPLDTLVRPVGKLCGKVRS